MFFSLKLHKLPYLNLFIFFNNILKKIPFSCYIKCNSNHLNEKIYISLRKMIFQFFSFLFQYLNENEGKSKTYINISWQFIFFSQNCIYYPVSSVSWRINIFYKKDYLSAYFIVLIKQYTKNTEYCHNILFF